MYNTKTYAVINLTDIGLIDFGQVAQTSSSTVRKSVDNTQFIIKWENGYTPTFITDITVTPVATYTHETVLTLVATAAWTPAI
jgi:hypothetical protein